MAKQLILVVDDNYDLRFVFTAILNHDGYRVAEATNGRDAIAKTLMVQPALILMDISMPVMSGLDAASAIRSHATMGHTIMVAVTGNTFSADDETLLKRLFNSRLTKPVSPSQILAEVGRLIGPPLAT